MRRAGFLVALLLGLASAPLAAKAQTLDLLPPGVPQSPVNVREALGRDIEPLGPFPILDDLTIPAWAYTYRFSGAAGSVVIVVKRDEGSFDTRWVFPEAGSVFAARFDRETRSLEGHDAAAFHFVTEADVARGAARLAHEEAVLVQRAPGLDVFSTSGGVFAFSRPGGILVAAADVATGSGLVLTGVAPAPLLPDPVNDAPHVEHEDTAGHILGPPSGEGRDANGVYCFRNSGGPLGTGPAHVACQYRFAVQHGVAGAQLVPTLPTASMGQLNASLARPEQLPYLTMRCTVPLPKSGMQQLTPVDCLQAETPADRGPGEHVLQAAAKFDLCLNPRTAFRCEWSVRADFRDAPWSPTPS